MKTADRITAQELVGARWSWVPLSGLSDRVARFLAIWMACVLPPGRRPLQYLPYRPGQRLTSSRRHHMLGRLCLAEQ